MLTVFEDLREPLSVLARLTTKDRNVAIRLPYRDIDDHSHLFPGGGHRRMRVRQAFENALKQGGEDALIASPAWRVGTPLP